jgi:tetratricopeptide (TPR) repeat protein
MRQLSIPEELALPKLLELDGLESGFRVHFDAGYRHLQYGRYEEAIKIAEQIVKAAGSDRYVISLGHLLRAESLRRLRRYQEAVDVVREALRWLELQVGIKAYYNESLAVYLKGCLHYTLRNKGDALYAFNYAKKGLEGSAVNWRIEGNSVREEDCKKLLRWLSHLTKLQTKLGAEAAFILPIYELLDQKLSRTGVVSVPPFQTGIPAELIAKFFPDPYVPLLNQTLSFFSLDPEAIYVALRISGKENFELPAPVNERDLLILELVNPIALRSGRNLNIIQIDADGEEPGIGLTPDNRSFVRMGDSEVDLISDEKPSSGQVRAKFEFRAVGSKSDEPKGIVRLLIKRDYINKEGWGLWATENTGYS